MLIGHQIYKVNIKELSLIEAEKITHLQLNIHPYHNVIDKQTDKVN